MTFTPPALDVLAAKTDKLERQLDIQLKRYLINPPEDNEPSSAKKQTSLEWWITRAQGVLDCGTGRDTAREVFNQLVNELRHVNKDNKEDNQKATWFLVGALLHRYFRVMQEYDDYNNTVRIWWWYVGSSRLFMAIRAALKFPEVPTKEAGSLSTQEFKEKDLAVMDDATIVIALEAFRDNMLLEVETDVPRYKKYAHLNKDVNFQKHLSEMILHYKGRAAPVLKQLKAIKFIKSLAAEVISQQTKITLALDVWHKLLVKEHAKFDSLDLEIIEAHITTHIKDESARERILDLLYTPHIKKKLESFEFDHESFLTDMKKGSSDTAVYTIVGGYCLLLQSKEFQTKGFDRLKFNLHEALGIEDKSELLTEKDKLLNIQFLEQFIKTNPEAGLQYDFFTSKDNLSGEIGEAKEALIKSIKKARKLEDQDSSDRQVQLI
ncbi:hypothetical protein [Legionella fallonii]|uniref:Uncharacterized protein n=1 Tax=Legionella fallonii LLAP-10 TaxID=1212491 RepID=A0A098G3I5_9GAMM|nr:hypothetical protein [Legionella fallonii]CEG56536.1 conserved protein of unknown function [Legionella fallonii LLAP-10]